MNLDPFEIYKTLDGIPPFQRDQVSRNYIDQSVYNLGTTFVSIGEGSNNDEVRVTLRMKRDHDWILLFLNVSLKEYPEFRILKKDHKILIKSGKIKRVDSLHLELKECKLDLNPGNKVEISRENHDSKEKKNNLGELPPQIVQNFHAPVGILQTNNKEANAKITNHKNNTKNFWGKFFWYFIVPLAVLLIGSYIAYQFHWN